MTLDALYLVGSGLLAIATSAVLTPRAWPHPFRSFGAIMAIGVSAMIPQLMLLGILSSSWVLWKYGYTQPVVQAGVFIHAVCLLGLGQLLYRIHRDRPVLDGVPVEDGAPLFQLPAEHPLPRIGWLPNLVLRIPEMSRVKVTRGIVFREVDGVKLVADVYQPRVPPSSPRSTLVYIHGGGWVSGTRRQSRYMMYELAAAGYVVFCITYRFVWKHSLFKGVQDCKAGLAWARRETEKYGGRSDHLILLGTSAGGHLAALLALTSNEPSLQRGFEQEDSSVQAAVVLYGIPEFEGLVRENRNPGLRMLLERLVIRGPLESRLEKVRALQPSSWIRPDAPPLLLVHGHQDQLVPFDESVRFYQQLKAQVPTVHLLEVPTGFHAFEMFPTPPHLRAMRVILSFIEAHSVPPVPRAIPAGQAELEAHPAEDAAAQRASASVSPTPVGQG